MFGTYLILRVGTGKNLVTALGGEGEWPVDLLRYVEGVGGGKPKGTAYSHVVVFTI